MSEKKSAPDSPALTREERLAAKLRENLHRRKSQARALNESARDSDDDSDDESEAADQPPPLSKPPVGS